RLGVGAGFDAGRHGRATGPAVFSFSTGREAIRGRRFRGAAHGKSQCLSGKLRRSGPLMGSPLRAVGFPTSKVPQGTFATQAPWPTWEFPCRVDQLHNSFDQLRDPGQSTAKIFAK